jgi:hypothetical protein
MPARGNSIVDVDAGLGHHEERTAIREPRGHYGCIRKELAAGVTANHSNCLGRLPSVRLRTFFGRAMLPPRQPGAEGAQSCALLHCRVHRLVCRMCRSRSAAGRYRPAYGCQCDLRDDHRRDTGEQHQGPRACWRRGRQGRPKCRRWRGGGSDSRTMVRDGFQRRSKQGSGCAPSTSTVPHRIGH